MFEGKTVLVTGAAGLIGSSLVDRLMAMENVRVIALGRNGEKLEKGFQEYLGKRNFSYVVQDVCQPLCLSETGKIDYIFHAAGSMARNVIYSKPLDVIRANLSGIQNCLDFLAAQKEKGIEGRLVVFSSITVYGNSSDADKTVTEEDTDSAAKLDEPYAAYAETKRMAEVLALAYHRQLGVNIVIARLGTVYGYTRFPPDTAFYSFIRDALMGQDIMIQNPSIARRDNIYIDDAVSALLTICERGKSGEAYNISSAGVGNSFAAADEMASIIVGIVNDAGLTGHKAAVRYVSEADKRQPGLILENDKLKALGWKPENGLTEGISKTVKPYLRSEKNVVRIGEQPKGYKSI